MQAIQLHAANLHAFQTNQLAEPELTQGQLILRMHAATLNYLDIAVQQGRFPVPAYPFIPVADGAGEIVAMADDVEGFVVGDRVIPHFMPAWLDGAVTAEKLAAMRGINLPGSLVEYLAVPANSVVKIPQHLNYLQAASLPVAATTAWNAVRAVTIGAHSKVLIFGTGGVSIFALQFAKALGAEVIITSSSDEKLVRAKSLGADHVVNYQKNSDWPEQIKEVTAGRGVDLVIDTVGGQNFLHALELAAIGGAVFAVGFINGQQCQLNLMTIITKALRVFGNNTGSVADLRSAVNFIEQQQLQVQIDKVYSSQDIVAAYTDLSAGSRHFGKLAIQLEF